jgi:hypothetical protein
MAASQILLDTSRAHRENWRPRPSGLDRGRYRARLKPNGVSPSLVDRVNRQVDVGFGCGLVGDRNAQQTLASPCRGAYPGRPSLLYLLRHTISGFSVSDTKKHLIEDHRRGRFTRWAAKAPMWWVCSPLSTRL